MPMQTTGDRSNFRADTTVSGRSTAVSSGTNGPPTECDALVRKRDALIYHEKVLKRKRPKLKQSPQKQRREREVFPVPFVLPSAKALVMVTQSNRVLCTFFTQRTPHPRVHIGASLSCWSTPIYRGVRATGPIEYQESVHADYLSQAMRDAKEIYLCSGDEDDAVQVLNIIHSASMLRRLGLAVPEISKELVEKISQWEKEGPLECVFTHLQCVTPRMNLLPGLRWLRYLNLRSTNMTRDGFIYLQECPNLVELDVSCCPNLTDLYDIQHIKTLKKLTVDGCAILNSFGALVKLPYLTDLNMSKTPITDAGIHALSECPKLSKIHLHDCQHVTNLNPLSLIRTLTVIEAPYCKSLTCVGELGMLPNLKFLNISKTSITDAGIHALRECPKLSKIHLHDCQHVTNLNPLSLIQTLTVIEAPYCKSLTCVGELGMLPNLSLLDLSGTPITDKDVHPLANSPSLVTLILCSCKNLIDLNPLSNIPLLERLDVSRCTSLERIRELGRPSLMEVDVSETRITDEEVYYLTLLREELRLPSINIKR